MTEQARAWCQEHGTVSSLAIPFSVAPPGKISPARRAQWESLYGLGTWKARPSWFLKPFAMLQSPFDETLWLDLDCEAMKPLDPLFNVLQNAEIALARENNGAMFNSGVVAFRKEAAMLKKWAALCKTKNHLFIGDQQVFSHLVKKDRAGFQELPAIYNWMAGRGFNPDALVMHWSNQWGKMFIELYGGAQGFLSKLS